MKTNYSLFSPRESRLARFVVAGFILSLAPLSAQTAAGGSASSGGTTAVPSSTPPAPLSQRPIMNTSPYNTGAKTTSSQGGTIYNPNNVNLSSPTVPAGTGTGTLSQNVNAGGGAGSGQSGATSSPSNP
jgi:hypothetical protein